MELPLRQQASGVVLAGGLFAQANAPHDHDDRSAERGVPVALSDASIERLDFPCVSCDGAVAIERTWRHFTSLGSGSGSRSDLRTTYRPGVSRRLRV